MKLYSFYTPSHDVLLNECFLPSIHNEYELILEKADQECKSASYMHDGWMHTMLKKVDLILRGIRENWGQPFLHSDVDVIFLRPTRDVLMKSLNGMDMAIQRNNRKGSVCAGFMAIQGNDRTQRLWEAIRKEMISQTEKTIGTPKNDQDLLYDELIPTCRLFQSVKGLRVLRGQLGWNAYNIRWKYLPDCFFGYGLVRSRTWKGEIFTVPRNIAVFHANYVLGIENKKKILGYVQDTVQKRSPDWPESRKLNIRGLTRK